MANLDSQGFALPEQNENHRPLCKPAKAYYDPQQQASLGSPESDRASTAGTPYHGKTSEEYTS
jgi:hypothetical protein